MSIARVIPSLILPALVLLSIAQTATVAAQTLERVAEGGVFKIGYREDAPPFSFVAEGGEPTGYTIGLCRAVAAAAQAHLGLAEMGIEYVAVGTEDRFEAVETGRIDLLCGATTATLSRRERVSFSIPTFVTGIAALLHADASPFLREVLAGQRPSLAPRYLVHEAFKNRKMGVRAQTTAEDWLRKSIADLATTGEVVTVARHEEGLELVRDRTLDAYFADRAILVGLVAASDAPDEFLIAERLFTYEPYALALAKGDEAFRLLVDRTLSRMYRSGDIDPIFAEYFGLPGQIIKSLFVINSLPE